MCLFCWVCAGFINLWNEHATTIALVSRDTITQYTASLFWLVVSSRNIVSKVCYFCWALFTFFLSFKSCEFYLQVWGMYSRKIAKKTKNNNQQSNKNLEICVWFQCVWNKVLLFRNTILGERERNRRGCVCVWGGGLCFFCVLCLVWVWAGWHSLKWASLFTLRDHIRWIPTLWLAAITRNDCNYDIFVCCLLFFMHWKSIQFYSQVFGICSRKIATKT